MKFLGYGMSGLVIVGLLGADVYLLLELFQEPAITWLILGLVWVTALINFAGIAIVMSMIEIMGMS